LKELNFRKFIKKGEQSAFSKSLNTLIVAFIAVILIATFFSKTIYNMTLPEVSSTEIAQGDIKKNIFVDGIYKFEVKEISSDADYKIDLILVTDGQYIKSGQEIASLDITAFYNIYSAKLAEANSAKSDYYKFKSKSLNQTIAELKNSISIEEKNYQIAKKEIDRLQEGTEEEILYSYISQVKQAELNLQETQKNSERHKALYKVGAVSTYEMEQAEQQFEEAAISHTIAVEALEDEKRNFEQSIKEAEAKVLASENTLAEVKSKLITQKDEYSLTLASLESRYRAAEAEMKLLDEIKGSGYKIISPVEGEVTDISIKNGQYVSKGSSIISVGKRQEYTIEGYIDADDFTEIKVGDEADLYMTKYTDKSIKGCIKAVSSSVENVQGIGDQIKVELEFAESNGKDFIDDIQSKLVHGEKVEISITKAKYCNKISPNSSIVYEYDEKTRKMNKYVFKIRTINSIAGKEYYAEKVKVVTGFEGDMNIEIAQGLESSDSIVINPSNEVQDGKRVYLKDE